MTRAAARHLARTGPFLLDILQEQPAATATRLGKGRRNGRTTLFQQFCLPALGAQDTAPLTENRDGDSALRTSPADALARVHLEAQDEC